MGIYTSHDSNRLVHLVALLVLVLVLVLVLDCVSAAAAAAAVRVPQTLQLCRWGRKPNT